MVIYTNNLEYVLQFMYRIIDRPHEKSNVFEISYLIMNDKYFVHVRNNIISSLFDSFMCVWSLGQFMINNKHFILHIHCIVYKWNKSFLVFFFGFIFFWLNFYPIFNFFFHSSKWSSYIILYNAFIHINKFKILLWYGTLK